MSILLCCAIVFQYEMDVLEYQYDPEPGTVRFEAGRVPPAGRLGASVSGGGDVNGDGFMDLVAGAPDGAGEAYLMLGPFDGDVPAGVWICRGRAEGARFGASVAFAGDVNGDGYDDLLVGAPGDWEGSGSLYLFLGAAEGVAPEPEWIAYGSDPGAAFGASVAGAGDLNGDGYDDIVVGAPGFAGGTGAAYAYFGGSTGADEAELAQELEYVVSNLEVEVRRLSFDEEYAYVESTDERYADWGVVGSRAGSRFGASVAAAGDLDGDGFDDLLIGSEGDSTATVFFGPAAERAPVVLAGGHVVAGAGDLNGDGYADLAVGGTDSVTIYAGSPAGPSRAATLAVFGGALAGGDLDSDGFSDLLVGADGSLYVFRGGAGGIAATPAWSAHEGGELGASVTAAGDLDGDGRPDWAAGAPADDRIRIYTFGASAGESAPADDPAEERVVVRERRIRSCSMASVDRGPALPIGWLILVLLWAARPRR